MERDREAFDHLMVLLDEVGARINSAHAPAQDYGTGVPLYRVEIHTIQAIGRNPGINMSELAGLMNVTKGAVSQTVNKLVRKGLVRKKRVSSDNRELTLFLTDLGWRGYENHEAFHERMYEVCRKYFGSSFRSRIKAHTTVINEINEIMDTLEKEHHQG